MSNTFERSSHVDLLVSLLIRYPQLSTITFDPRQRVFRLLFMIESPTPDDIQEFRKACEEHFTTYQAMVPGDYQIWEWKQTRCGRISMIEITRDSESFMRQELSIICHLLVQYFPRQFEQEMAKEPSEQMAQDGMIDSLLSNNSWDTTDSLVGYRDNDKVLVFSNPGSPDTKEKSTSGV